jgi:hypothetical protein
MMSSEGHSKWYSEPVSERWREKTFWRDSWSVFWDVEWRRRRRDCDSTKQAQNKTR